MILINNDATIDTHLSNIQHKMLLTVGKSYCDWNYDWEEWEGDTSFGDIIDVMKECEISYVIDLMRNDDGIQLLN